MNFRYLFIQDKLEKIKEIKKKFLRIQEKKKRIY